MKWGKERIAIITDISLTIKKMLSRDLGFNLTIDNKANSLLIVSANGHQCSVNVGFKKEWSVFDSVLKIYNYDRDIKSVCINILNRCLSDSYILIYVDIKEYHNDMYWLTDKQRSDIEPRTNDWVTHKKLDKSCGKRPRARLTVIQGGKNE
jgi:hypothetical protein